MLSQATTLLADDHSAVDKLLLSVRAALEAQDASRSHAALDLFWARLAVHIRAEHLHLFPAVLQRIINNQNALAEPSLAHVKLIIEELRDDHDFFMHELARGVSSARDLIVIKDELEVHAGLNRISQMIDEVEGRLRGHNEIEEETIYRWVAAVLDVEEQAQLAAKIQKELTNRPPRFTTNGW